MRARRNCSTEEAYQTESMDLKNRFKERGYPNWVLKRAKNKANLVTREQTLTDSRSTLDQDSENDTPRAILTYNLESIKIKRILPKNLKILKCDPIVGQSVTNRPMVTHRKGKSLRDFLVKNDVNNRLTGPQQHLQGFFSLWTLQSMQI